MRQFGCIEVTLHDALLLRDAMRPLARVEPYDAVAMIRFCEKLYDGILKLKVCDQPSINISLEEHEALFINQFVGNEDWQNALAILEQSWLALYEVRNHHVYPRPERPAHVPEFASPVPASEPGATA